MILLIISNICIFYSILDKKYPHFLFMFRMSIKQIIEGIIVVLICIIPNYEKMVTANDKYERGAILTRILDNYFIEYEKKNNL